MKSRERRHLLPRQGVAAVVNTLANVNGGEWNVTKNLIVTEGLVHILNVALGSASQTIWLLSCSLLHQQHQP